MRKVAQLNNPTCNAQVKDNTTGKPRQCLNDNGKWYHWPSENYNPEIAHDDKLAGFYSMLCPTHTKTAIRNGSLALWVPPRTSLEDEVSAADYQDKVNTDRKDLIQTIAAEVAKAGPITAGYINKENVMDQPSRETKDVWESFIIAGTGSKSLKLAVPEFKTQVHDWLIARLQRSQERQKAMGKNLVVMSGMAEGFDELLAMCAIELEIELWLCIPNLGYVDYYWGPPGNGRNQGSVTKRDRRGHAKYLMQKADKIMYADKIISEEQGRSVAGLYLPKWDFETQRYSGTEHANMARNSVMVRYADAFLVYNPASRGTADCFRKIQMAGKVAEVIPSKFNS